MACNIEEKVVEIGRKALADLVRAADAKGLSKKELAKRTGFKESFVSRTLSPKGKQVPSLMTLGKIADAIGLELQIVIKERSKEL